MHERAYSSTAHLSAEQLSSLQQTDASLARMLWDTTIIIGIRQSGRKYKEYFESKFENQTVLTFPLT